MSECTLRICSIPNPPSQLSCVLGGLHFRPESVQALLSLLMRILRGCTSRNSISRTHSSAPPLRLFENNSEQHSSTFLQLLGSLFFQSIMDTLPSSPSTSLNGCGAPRNGLASPIQQRHEHPYGPPHDSDPVSSPPVSNGHSQ